MLSTCAKIEIFQIFLLPCLPVGSRPHNCYSDSLSCLVNFSPNHLPQSVVFSPDQHSRSVVFLLSHLRVVLWGCQESGCVLLLVVVAVFTGSGYSGSGDGAFAESAWLVMCTQFNQFDASSSSLTVDTRVSREQSSDQNARNTGCMHAESSDDRQAGQVCRCLTLAKQVAQSTLTGTSTSCWHTGQR